MLDFGADHSRRGPFSTRDTWRIVMLVAALALVMYLMHEAGRPNNWYWLWHDAPPAASSGAAVDTRLDTADRQLLPPDAFVAPSDGAPREGEAARLLPGIRREQLATIRDDTLIRTAERDSLFGMLDVLGRTRPAAIAAASIGRVALAQLHEQPDVYRGRVVSLRGAVRRAERRAAPENDFGIQAYYVLWLQPSDAATTPMAVYACAVPEGFPLGADIDEDVEVFGCFFKRWAYRATDGMRTTPLVLARAPRWHPATTSAPAGPRGPGVALMVIVAIGFAGAVVWYVYKRTPVDERLRQRWAQRGATTPAAELGSQMPDVEATDEDP